MEAPEKPRRRASPWQVAKAVASGFFGVRGSRHDEDVELKPVHVVIAGVIGAVLFVCVLLLLVNFILSRIGAAS